MDFHIKHLSRDMPLYLLTHKNILPHFINQDQGRNLDRNSLQKVCFLGQICTKIDLWPLDFDETDLKYIFLGLHSNSYNLIYISTPLDPVSCLTPVDLSWPLSHLSYRFKMADMHVLSYKGVRKSWYQCLIAPPTGNDLPLYLIH